MQTDLPHSHDDSAKTTTPATLGAQCRLKTRRHFRRVYKRGNRATGHWLTVVGILGRTGVDARMGLSVSKQHGGAVRRNKIKRLLREAFRAERHRLPTGLDVVLIPQKRAERYPLAALRLELVELINRLQEAPSAQRRGRSRSRRTSK